MLKNRKILIIGLDGGTWTVLKPAIEQGYMPFLKSLVDQGASGILKSTIPAITPAAWGGFQTGKNPGKTGVFDFAYWDKEDKKSHFVSARDLGETFWDILSRYGNRIAVLNVPMTYPPKPINGYLISGLLTPSMESDFTFPAELKKELLASVPNYHIFDIKKIAHYRSQSAKIEHFLDELNAIIENRTRAALWLVNKEPLDVCMVHFQATDVLQHLFWHFLDTAHPLFDAAKRTLLFNDFFQVLDRKIELIHNAFAEKNGQPLVVIISDHGFQTHRKRFNLSNWLVQEGYLAVHKNRQPGSTNVPMLKKITRTMRIGKVLSMMLPKKTIGLVDKKYISKTEVYQWDTSTAYSVGRSNEGFIYLLTQDEQRKSALTAEIRQKLLQIKDPETGQPVVQKVRSKNDLYRGDQLERMPDLIIEPEASYSFTGYYQPGEGLFHTVTLQADMHIGKHHPDGILIAAGSRICKNNTVKADILDIAPTLLWYMGIPAPLDMDGTLLAELFSEDFRNENVTEKNAELNIDSTFSKSDYSMNDEKNIEQRLKDLGYL